ncbi:MAG TPA: PKD domain-containing protein [Methanoculleus sp.]|nr:PKD domain-containing protein [Methanoculleus sp.]
MPYGTALRGRSRRWTTAKGRWACITHSPSTRMATSTSAIMMVQRRPEVRRMERHCVGGPDSGQRGGTGGSTSIALDQDGYFHISYYDGSNGDLKYARLAPLCASFSVDTRSGTAPLTVQFSDTSSSWDHRQVWHFGDGGYSTEAHPSHTYITPGTYTVFLTVSDATETAISTQVDFITVTAGPEPTPSPSPSPTPQPSRDSGGGGDDGNTTVFYRPPVLMGESEHWFSVDISVFKEWNIMPADIVMYYHDGDGWRPLDTTYDRVSGNHFYYVADNPGYFQLAIGDRTHGPYPPDVEAMPETPGTPAPGPTLADTRAAPDLTPAPTSTVAANISAPEPGEGIPFPVIAGVGAVLVGGGAFVVNRRWWIRRQNPALFRNYD